MLIVLVNWSEHWKICEKITLIVLYKIHLSFGPEHDILYLSHAQTRQSSRSSYTQNIDMSSDMRFQTMWYVRQAKTQISLCIRAVWSETLLVAWIVYVQNGSDKLLTET